MELYFILHKIALWNRSDSAMDRAIALHTTKVLIHGTTEQHMYGPKTPLHTKKNQKKILSVGKKVQ